MKSWMILVLAAAVARGEDSLTYTGAPKVEEPQLVISNAAPAAVSGERLRLGSYNLENFEDGNGDGPLRTVEVAGRHAGMAASIENKIDPDVLVLQEVENDIALRTFNQALAKPYPLGFITRLGTGSPNKEKMNLAVLSRHPLENLREIDFGPLTGPGRPTRGLLSFIVPLTDQHALLVYVVHLKSNFGKRDKNISQRRTALTLLREDAKQVIAAAGSRQLELVIVGDTNVDPDVPSFADDTSFQPLSDLRDLWREVPAAERITLPTRYGDPKLVFPPVAFDRFFVDKPLSAAPWVAQLPKSRPEGVVTNDVTVLPGLGGQVSDHYPVWMDVLKN